MREPNSGEEHNFVQASWTNSIAMDCTVHDVVGDQCALFALFALCALVPCLHCALYSRSELTVGSSPPDHKASPTCLLLSSSPTLLSSLSF